MPGEATRFGPAKEKGLARGDQTGSVRMLRPATWIKSVAWPIMVTRRSAPSTRSRSGADAGPCATRFGQRARLPLVCHLRRSRMPPGSTPSGLKKRLPSKWSETGPV
ncbi:hypothetical protein D3C72_2153790 [compost metagenome]